MGKQKKTNKVKSKNQENVFSCGNCRRPIRSSGLIGTKHRNHCPFCLWSRHLDSCQPGDRKAECQARMEPIGLTFKHEGVDKYGKLRQGELMIIHKCLGCGKLSINRIAGDDQPEAILNLLKKSQKLSPEEKSRLKKNGIDLIPLTKEKQVRRQLFGRG